MKNVLLSLFLFAFLLSCNNNGDSNTKNSQPIAIDVNNLAEKIKYQAGDPFIETFKKSEFFKVSGLENHILETKSGTILSIPKGAFRDKNGNIVEKEIQIEINDIKSIEDQILSNVTSQLGEGIMQSGGSIYLNATHNGEQLELNEDSPIYIETTIENPEGDYLIFEGIRNEKGEMQWTNPVQPKRHLIPVDLEELDFLPDGFQLAVEKGMPFKNHTKADKNLVDSLYYSLTNYFQKQKPIPKPIAFEGEQSLPLDDGSSSQDKKNNGEVIESLYNCKGIDPASIKVIKSNKYANTFIATRDFEKRLKEIHKTRRPELLDIYLKNLELDLSKCDSMVEEKLSKSNASALKFMDFARENLGNVENLPRSVTKLSEHYTKELEKTRNQLEKLENEYQKGLDKQSERYNKVVNEYKQLLTKRLEYRLNKFGYEVKNLGWSNIAKILEPLEKFKLEIVVENGASYDYVNVYTLDKNIQSIFALTSQNKTLFDRGYNHDQFLLYRKQQSARAIVIAYKNGVPYYASKSFSSTPEVHIDLSPKQVSEEDLKKVLRGFDRGHNGYNKLRIDLEYQALFYKEKLRRKSLKEEKEFINALARIALDCTSTFTEVILYDYGI